MKTTFRICIWSVALLLTTSLAFARADSKRDNTGNYTRFGGRLYRLYPAYSVHNYKQPDKANLARRFNLDRLQIHESFAPSNQHNYKQPTISSTRAILLTLSWENQHHVSGASAANYKRQVQ